MASGWGCQHLTSKGENKAWCRLLKKTCDPGCRGCVLYGEFLFSQPGVPSRMATEKRKTKQRSDDPLSEK